MVMSLGLLNGKTNELVVLCDSLTGPQALYKPSAGCVMGCINTTVHTVRAF